ncbi:telomerase reverse transcriptase [Euphorbia peplus]|nr:telomerase reverse transcriptase [Euphorbia peplus]
MAKKKKGRKKTKKRRVPKILWRLFKDKPLPLSTTITSLTHSSQSCPCNSQLCLSCCGSRKNALSILLHPGDPDDYRNILHHSFAVLHDNAPPFSPNNFHPCSQHEIVAGTIEFLIRDRSASQNVICSGYDKHNRTSPIVELLTSSAWDLLLKRVGDCVMTYLLRHTSIFFPVPPRKYHQVTGPHVIDLAFNSMKRAPQPQWNRQTMGGIANANPRVDTRKHSTPSVQVSSCCAGCNDRKCIKPSGRHPPNKYRRISASETASEMIGADLTKHEELPNEELMIQRKRTRPFRLQESKKRKRSDNDERGSIKAFKRYPANKDGHPNILEAVSSTTGACTVKHGGLSSEEHKGLNSVIKKPRKKLRLYKWIRRKEHMLLDDETTCTVKHGGISNEEHTDSNSVIENPKKKSRLFGWLCGMKRRCLDDQKAFGSSRFLMDTIEEDNALQSLQCDHDNRKSHSSRKIPQLCSCCHVLQASDLVTKGLQIEKQSMFYNSKKYISVLPQNHMLYSLSASFAGSTSLLESIFGLSTGNINGSSDQCSHSSDFCLIGSACLYHSLIKLLKTLIHRSHHCNYARLLDKHLMVLSQNTNKKNQIEEVKSYCSKSRVVSFIWAVCRNLIPPDLLGSPSNWRILTRNIGRFIRLRRSEVFSVKQCVHKLKVSEFPFLSDKHSVCHLGVAALDVVPGKNLCELNDGVSCLKQKLLEKWIFWVFQDLVVPLLQTHFYVTESEHGKEDIFYYRKLFWEELIITSLKGKNYQNLSAGDVDSIINNRSFGFSKLRLLPKENGVRMLANLKAPSRILLREYRSYKGTLGKPPFRCKTLKYKYFKSVNSVLRDTHAVLKGIKLKEPEKLGSSVFNYNEIYGKLCLFMTGLKNGSSTMPKVFVVIADVSHAFDSVDQDKLLQVLKDVIVKDEYLLQQSAQVASTKTSLWVNRNHTLADSNLSYSIKKFSSATLGSSSTLLVNQGLSRRIEKKKIFSTIKEHVKRNILQLNGSFYLQCIGIPQGSILSPLLCSLYYGHLERNVLFPFLEKISKPIIEDLSARQDFQGTSAAGTSNEDRVIPSSCYTLIRLIDDFCFISTSKKQADAFSSSLHLTEFMKADYTRFFNSHIRSTLTVSWQGKLASYLEMKLYGYIRPRCHPIFYDSNINSAPVVRLNIYQAFVLCAMKFHCYVSELSYMYKLRPRFYLKIISRSFRFMYTQIKRTMDSIQTCSDFQPVLQLERDEVVWLGLNAFIKVLKRKQSRHRELLGLLNKKLGVHKINESNASSELKYAVDSSHSSVMWKIKY